MSLSDRKMKILHAIINDYIATAEPVGSRTIAKKYDFGLSSATIRNEMSDLEEMGFIIQPHASAGRIPSDLGYRLYVDSLMQQTEIAENQKGLLMGMLQGNINQIDYLMDQTAKVLSAMTNYTSIISEPIIKSTKLNKISYLSLDSSTLVIIVAAEGAIVKNYTFNVEYMPNDDELFYAANVINKAISGNIMDGIDRSVIDRLNKELPGYGEIIGLTVKAIEKTAKSTESIQFHLSGTNNILTFPEFSDVEKAKNLMQSLEEKESLKTLLANPKNDGGDVQIDRKSVV